ncbi:hypothetical protein, partial [Saliphagus infecundisoli]|uniref:hypothetical protein n=1 Tax=Saliphagus infecundisoli TaxID=1849069 RepID=UPI001CD26DA2
MSGSRRFELVEHLSNGELDQAINAAQKADETCLVRRLCFVKISTRGGLSSKPVKLSASLNQRVV